MPSVTMARLTPRSSRTPECRPPVCATWGCCTPSMGCEACSTPLLSRSGKCRTCWVPQFLQRKLDNDAPRLRKVDMASTWLEYIRHRWDHDDPIQKPRPCWSERQSYTPRSCLRRNRRYLQIRFSLCAAAPTRAQPTQVEAERERGNLCRRSS